MDTGFQPKAHQSARKCDYPSLSETPKPPKAARAKPRRQPLPEQLERVGEEVSEKLDIVPAKFFVYRHIDGTRVLEGRKAVAGQAGHCEAGDPERSVG